VPPTSISYQSIDSTWTQWGWSAAFTRQAAQQFSAITNATSGGFALQGSGQATVTTPPYYAPGSVWRATTTGPLATPRLVTADANGRLQIPVDFLVDLPTVAAIGYPTPPPPTVTVTIAPAR
jgi:hypothetical protein